MGATTKDTGEQGCIPTPKYVVPYYATQPKAAAPTNGKVENLKVAAPKAAKPADAPVDKEGAGIPKKEEGKKPFKKNKEEAPKEEAKAPAAPKEEAKKPAALA